MSKWVDEAMYYADTATATSNHKDYLDLLRAHLTTQAEMCEKLAEALLDILNGPARDNIPCVAIEAAESALTAYLEIQK